jgi:hypothetical protein
MSVLTHRGLMTAPAAEIAWGYDTSRRRSRMNPQVHYGPDSSSENHGRSIELAIIICF